MSESVKDEKKDFENRHVESVKLLFDLFKHLTTISTGSILILVTFLEKLFKFPSNKWLVSVSLAGFIISVVSSLFLMFLMVPHLRDKFKRDSSEANTVLYCFITSSGSFVIGIISLTVFAIFNFYNN